MHPDSQHDVCGACGLPGLVPLFAAHDRNQQTTAQVFSVARCTACGIVQTVPRPAESDLPSLYPVQYFPAAVDRHAQHRFQQEKIKLVRKHRNTGALLDVGAGIGLFVQEALDAGYAAMGIEISGQAVATGLQHSDVSLVLGDFLKADLHPSGFDIVTFWHVFEHLLHPYDVLHKVHRILRPHGIVVIAVPNFASLQARLFRSHWYHLDVPRHLFHFSPSTLQSVVEHSGFSVQDIQYRWRDHDPAGMLGSIMRLSPPGETLLHRAVRKIAGKPVARIAAEVESILHRGGTFALVATRE